MALDPQMMMMLFNMLASQAPTLLRAVKQAGGLDKYPNLTNALVNKNLDPGIMEENLLQRVSPDYTQELQEHPDILLEGLDYDYSPSAENWEDSIDQNLFPSDFLSHKKALKPNLSSENLQLLRNDTQIPLEETGGVAVDLAPAVTSATSMLLENPKIGTPNDPNMLPFQNPMENLPSEVYEAVPRTKVDPFEGAAFNASDVYSDDDPMDAKAKIFRKLVRGY